MTSKSAPSEMLMTMRMKAGPIEFKFKDGAFASWSIAYVKIEVSLEWNLYMYPRFVQDNLIILYICYNIRDDGLVSTKM